MVFQQVGSGSAWGSMPSPAYLGSLPRPASLSYSLICLEDRQELVKLAGEQHIENRIQLVVKQVYSQVSTGLQPVVKQDYNELSEGTNDGLF